MVIWLSDRAGLDRPSPPQPTLSAQAVFTSSRLSGLAAPEGDSNVPSKKQNKRDRSPFRQLHQNISTGGSEWRDLKSPEREEAVPGRLLPLAQNKCDVVRRPGSGALGEPSSNPHLAIL